MQVFISAHVFIVFWNFFNLSCELCFALEAKDSVAIVEVGEDELFLTSADKELFFGEDLSGDFLPAMAVSLLFSLTASFTFSLVLTPAPRPLLSPILLCPSSTCVIVSFTSLVSESVVLSMHLRVCVCF